MFNVHLDRFEGPLDLLLFFVRRDELDIRDIPIARITDEYLGYVRHIERLDLDTAADFVYLAAELVHIKVQMLLPRPPGPDGEAPEDPRTPLVERLLEYVRFKEAAALLEERLDERARRATRGAASDERARLAAEPEEPTLRVSLFDLVRVLQRVLARAPEKEPVRHHLLNEAWTVDEQRTWLLERTQGTPASFVALVEGKPRGFVIATFLAVLELVRSQRIRLVLGVGSDDFALEAVPDAEAEVDVEAEAPQGEAEEPV